MVLLDMKNDKTLSLPLNSSSSKDKPLVSFADLLKGVSEKKESKSIQNGSSVLALGVEEKSTKSIKSSSKTENQESLTKIQSSKSSPKDNLASLLSGDKLSQEEKSEILELDPKFIQNQTLSEMRTLISNAKNYLKDVIQNSDDYKKSEIKELPKTLGGLIEAAKKFGIDVNKITIEEVKKVSQTALQTPKIEKEQNQSILATPSETQLNETKSPKSEIQQKEMLQDKKNSVVNEKLTSLQPAEIQRGSDIKSSSLQAQNETPLFKAQTVSEHTSTEQIVQIKPNNLSKTDQKREKERSADDALKSLLSDDKLQKSTNSISLESTSALATTGDNPKTLEQLLSTDRSTSESNQQSTKIESITTHKADSVEVKINEAKQMIRYLSDDIKSAIDEYKSPFTRVKIQLNPEHLGEVDLTIIQRGKNLHVNLSSNNVAINALSMNVNELKAQLNNSGINNATLNFSDTSQQSGSANSGGAEHQKRQNEQKAHTEYNYFESEEAHEEILSSLEIIVPRYI